MIAPKEKKPEYIRVQQVIDKYRELGVAITVQHGESDREDLDEDETTITIESDKFNVKEIGDEIESELDDIPDAVTIFGGLRLLQLNRLIPELG